MAIRLTNLGKCYGDKAAVNNISLHVPAGSFYGFLGPNGAGKTTTIRMITGLLAADNGDAVVDGYSISKNPVEVKSRIGVLPDTLALFDRLSFWEHLTMAGRLYNLSAQETEDRATDLLKLLGLWADRGVFASDGSHGMRKKLALAIALIHGPKILFLDEPFEGVDPIAGKVIRDLLRKLSAAGTTIFLTSHILEIIERLVDHVAIIVDGQIALSTSMVDLNNSGQTLEDIFIETAGSDIAEEIDLSWLGHNQTDEPGAV